MPKPVLSDSLYNADDVASAIVNNVDLGVINTDLAVTDISDKIVIDSAYSLDQVHLAFKFNNFVFINLNCVMFGGTPTSNDVLYTIDSGYRPSVDQTAMTVSHQGDLANYIRISSSTGEITINNAHEFSGSDNVFRININAWYRI